ncbi:MAG: peptidoglycan D,D-transpeptidase FtsI family protein [Anaerolineae bacterium]
MLTDTATRGNDRRMTVIAFCFTFGFTVIVSQLVRYQIFEHTRLEQEANYERIRERELPAHRGFIVDIHGNPLAINGVQWNISVSPPLIPDSKKEPLAYRLANLLELPRDQVYAALMADRPWVLLATHVDQKVGEAIMDIGVHGITCEPRPLRNYPEGSLFAHLVGFVNETGDGFYGVEGYYNPTLKGSPGKKLIEQDPAGYEIPIPSLAQTSPQPGASLVLTVDRNIQTIIQEELERALEEFGAERGTVMVMNPRTGAILASYSVPAYDPNHFVEADPSVLSDPAISGIWEPGSIMKVVTWGAGLDSGTISPGTTFYDDGALEVGGRVIYNWDRKGRGLVTMEEGLIQSLNTVAAFISTSMGTDRFYNYLRRFGFGATTGVDLASEEPGMMRQPGNSDWFPSDLGTNAFGQGIAVTPLQMITAVAAVANHGILMQPYIVHQFITQDENGQEQVTQVEPMSVRGAISREAADTLVQMMVTAVEREGYSKARVTGYRIAGKTGTAQIPTAYGYHPTDTIASFVGFAPADDPQFVILVRLDKPTASPWGTQTAAPTFRAIAERLFVYLQIPPDEVRLAGQ